MDASPSEYHVNISHKRPRETPQAPSQPQPQPQPQHQSKFNVFQMLFSLIIQRKKFQCLRRAMYCEGKVKFSCEVTFNNIPSVVPYYGLETHVNRW